MCVCACVRVIGTEETPFSDSNNNHNSGCNSGKGSNGWAPKKLTRVESYVSGAGNNASIVHAVPADDGDNAVAAQANSAV